MPRIARICATVATWAFFWVNPSGAQPLDPKIAGEFAKTAILTTAAEGALASVAVLRDTLGSHEVFTWHVEQEGSSWRMTVETSDGSIGYSASGYGLFDERNNYVVAYVGTGAGNDKPLVVSGQGFWIFDSARSDYIDMNFRQVLRVGEATDWGLVLGAEVIVGAAAGGAAGFGAAGPVGAIAGALTLGAGMVSASNAAKTILKSGSEERHPSPPERFSPPAEGAPLEPGEGTILVATLPSGEVLGYGIDGSTKLSGQFDPASGAADGTIGE